MSRNINGYLQWLLSINNGKQLCVNLPLNGEAKTQTGLFSLALERYTSGPGIHKWMHYLDFYDQRFKDIDRPLRILEIGVQSGGSLNLWKQLCTDDSTIIGIDINEACLQFAGGNVYIEIGSQADVAFLEKIALAYGPFDVVVDDGSHIAEHQEASFRMLANHMAPGGTYFIEDIHGKGNAFAGFLFGLLMQLNEHSLDTDVFDCHVNSVQRAIASVEFGAFYAAVTFRQQPLEKLVAAKWGDYWIPYG